MTRQHQFRKFKPYIMRYVHRADPNFEPVLRDLLDHENAVYNELTEQGLECTRGERCGKSWEVVFNELAGILTPDQVQKMIEHLREDFDKVCVHLHEMAETERILVGDHGGES